MYNTYRPIFLKNAKYVGALDVVTFICKSFGVFCLE